MGGEHCLYRVARQQRGEVGQGALALGGFSTSDASGRGGRAPTTALCMAVSVAGSNGTAGVSVGGEFILKRSV